MLRRFTLTHNKRDGGWDLKNQIGKTVRTFRTKADALQGGALERLAGGATVLVHGKDGRIQEERAFPRWPRRSSG
jgi:hypothetical protein